MAVVDEHNINGFFNLSFVLHRVKSSPFDFQWKNIKRFVEGSSRLFNLMGLMA